MKKHWIEYTASWDRNQPMTFWVHVENDGKCWSAAQHFEPPAPSPVPGRGYPLYCVEIDGVTFRFTSLDELDVCTRTLALRLLPSIERLCAARGAGARADRHWLKRLPGTVRSAEFRERAVKYLCEARERFERDDTRG